MKKNTNKQKVLLTTLAVATLVSTVASIEVVNVQAEETKIEKPIISLSNASPTNQDVRVTIEYPENAVVKEYKIGNKGGWVAYKYKDGLLITENTTIYSRATDANGNVSEVETLVIDNINKTPISFNVEINSQTLFEDGSVDIEFPEEAVVKEYKIGEDGEWLPYLGEIIFDDDTMLYLRITDIYGNQTVVEKEIKLPENLKKHNRSNEQDIKALLRLGRGDFILQTSPTASFGVVKLTAGKQTVSTSFEKIFKVIDARGTQEGWRVNVTATPFVEETFNGFVGTPVQLPIGSLSLDGFSTVKQVGTVHNSQSPTLKKDVQIIDSGAVNLVTAKEGEGMGEFNLTFDDRALHLVVDSTTAKIDKVNYPDQSTPYVSTITWDLITGP